MKKIQVLQDDSSHWFVIPNELAKTFFIDLVDIDFVDSGEFDEKYGQYMTGGSINNVQLYIDDSFADKYPIDTTPTSKYFKSK